MARRKTLNRKRNSDRKSIDSIASGLLDSDTSVLGEEQTFWWNHLQEKTFPSHSLTQDKNETARQLNDSSRMDPGTPSTSEWWKNLDRSGSEHAATSSRRNLSAAMIKSNILQTSTSESEKEDLRKRKVHLKGTNRKSTNNAFSRALDDTEVTVPLKLQKRANYSDSHSDLDSKVSQKRLQEDEEDNPSLTENILKSKPSISRRRKDKSEKDQNLFQDILMEDDVLNDNTIRRSIALQKESSKRSMHRDIGTRKAHTDDQRKSMRASQTIESRETDSPNLLAPNAAVSNTNESAQSSEESETKISHNKYLKLKSDFMQRARKSVGKNAFADALADDGGASFSTSNLNNENDTRKSPLTTPSSSLSKRSINRSKTKDITHENSPIYRSLRSSLNAAKKQSLDIPVQAQDNIEADLSSSSLDDNESRGKRSIFLKPKSRVLKSLRKSVTKNLYEEILEEESNSARKSNVSIKDSHASFERDKTISAGQVRSLTLEKSSQSKSNKTMNAEDSSDISTVLSNGEKDVSEKSNVFVGNKSKLLEKSGLMNASKSSSEKTNTSMVPETPEKETSSRKSTREETLKEHTNAILTDGSTSSNEIVIHENISDDSHDDIVDVEHDSSMPKRMSESNSAKEARLTRNSLRNRSETPKRAKIGIHKVIDNSRNDANMEHDTSMLKRVSETNSAKTRLTRNNLRNRSETPKLANIGIHKVIDNSRNDANMEHDSSMSKRVSKSSPAKETRVIRNSFRNRSETPAKGMELSKRSTNWIADIEEGNANAELNTDISRVNSTRISKVSANVGTRKSTILSAEMETTDDEDADSGMQIERNSTLTKATGNRAVSRQSVQSTSKTSIKEGKETTDRQKSLDKSQNYRNIPIKASGKDISSKASSSKLNLSKSLRKIDNFFKVKQSSMDKQPNKRVQKSQFDTEKMEKIKAELERIKNREMAAMKITTDKKESVLKAKNVLSITLKKAPKKKRLANPTKVVDKAFLVDGEIYKAPRLPRPKYWATDRLYKFLWKHMEPKYKLATRLKSEKFVQELAKIITFIQRRKNYENYKSEMEALMKEMARLKIINTRNDFYYFCQDFLPYEFRVKVVPMLMPGNKMNIPYDPEKLHIPLLDT